jgi:hypothetical protein
LPDYITPSWHATVQTANGPATVSTQFSGFGIRPLVDVSGGQALLVIGVYALAFTFVAIVLTWRRETLE